MRSAGLVAGVIAVSLALSASANAQKKTEPLLTKVKKQHCLAMYDFVAKSLKGKGAETVSIATRNGLKDFFVTRPGRVDCSGQRELPWSDDKDKDFIAAALKAAKTDMTASYGIAAAPRATAPKS